MCISSLFTNLEILILVENRVLYCLKRHWKFRLQLQKAIESIENIKQFLTTASASQLRENKLLDQ